MRHYETTYILRPNLGEEQFTEIIDRTNAIITNDGGTVIKLDRWGMKRLAYEIKKEIQGYYVYLNYAGQPKSVAEIERLFKIDDRLLRYLTIKLSDSIDAEGVEQEMQAFAAKTAAIEAAASDEEDSPDKQPAGEPKKEDADNESPAKDTPAQEEAAE